MKSTRSGRSDRISQRGCTSAATAFRSIAGFVMTDFRTGSALEKNASGLSFFMYSAFIQRSLLISNTAGDLEMPEMSKISASSQSV